MAHTIPSLEKMKHSDSARFRMNYKNKFDTVLSNINSELLDLKNKFTKLESDLGIYRNIYIKLVDQVARLGPKCWDNEQYSKRKRI